MIRYHWQLDVYKLSVEAGMFLLSRTSKTSPAKPTPPLPRSLTP